MDPSKYSPEAYQAFQTKVTAAGLSAVDHGQGHWQIKGGVVVVSYYPARGTIYIVGTHAGRRGRSAEEAIAQAKSIPKMVPQEHRVDHPKNKKRKRMVNELWRHQKGKCFWCKKPMTSSRRMTKEIPESVSDMFATLDHKIPRARGGNNGSNNLVLAHRRCNEDRGSDMAEYKMNNPHVEVQPLPPQGASNPGVQIDAASIVAAAKEEAQLISQCPVPEGIL